jgi:ParB-like chromosome segregation protein Spo0J
MPQVYEDIIVDAEFAALIPPLTADEREQLEANISAHGGARDPLVVWARGGKLTLVDGHNRYAICKAHGLPFKVVTMELVNRLRDEIA